MFFFGRTISQPQPQPQLLPYPQPQPHHIFRIPQSISELQFLFLINFNFNISLKNKMKHVFIICSFHNLLPSNIAYYQYNNSYYYCFELFEVAVAADVSDTSVATKP